MCPIYGDVLISGCRVLRGSTVALLLVVPIYTHAYIVYV